MGVQAARVCVGKEQRDDFGEGVKVDEGCRLRGRDSTCGMGKCVEGRSGDCCRPSFPGGRTSKRVRVAEITLDNEIYGKDSSVLSGGGGRVAHRKGDGIFLCKMRRTDSLFVFYFEWKK